MADITRRPFLNRLRADPSVHIQHFRNGSVRHEGAGVAFWYRPATAALAEVPLDDRQQTLLFHARTSDFQDVTVQATVTYRVVDPTLAAKRIAFDIDPTTGQWTSDPIETLSDLLRELAQQPAIEKVATMTVTEALARGVGPIRAEVAGVLADDPRLSERGLAVTDVRVVAVRADSDLERALQTETRERVQQEADKATFDRRAMAVESERAIAENELQNQIELARREETLVNQVGQNERQRATNEATANRILVESQVAEQRAKDEAKAEGIRQVGEAQADVEEAKMRVVQSVDQGVLLALAARDLARNVPRISNLTVTPDLVVPMLARLGESMGGGSREVVAGREEGDGGATGPGRR
ncbi:MAG: SPFH domain-containing protein [Acidimicrobiia bacterium]|nr:SPFH domain-containing protein [Acidimicrobiia bacterium]